RPVGDVDVVRRKHRVDSAAEKRGVMAGERRDDQELWIGLAVLRQITAEMQERAERFSPDDLLCDADAPAVHFRGGDAELRFAVAAGGSLRQVPRPPRPAARAGVRG